MIKAIALIIIAIFSLSSLSGCSSFGRKPYGEHLIEIQKSSNYDKKLGKFINNKQNIVTNFRKNFSFTKVLREYWQTNNVLAPPTKLPSDKPNLETFLKASSRLKFIWLGHSSFLVNIDGKILLYDPVFSNNASPFGFAVKRFQEPSLKLNELPNIDFIIISHDHYDHLDKNSVQFFKDKKTKFLVPLGISSHLISWGIPKENIFELDWWKQLRFEELTITCTPAQHFSGRGLNDRNQTLWASWVVESNSKKVFFSGDSGYDDHFKKIGDKFGPFDLAFMENGQYNKLWAPVHMDPKETAQATIDLKAKAMLPVHWGMFTLSTHNWFDPIEEAVRHAKNFRINLLTPKLGQVVTIPSKERFEPWWRRVVDKINP